VKAEHQQFQAHGLEPLAHL